MQSELKDQVQNAEKQDANSYQPDRTHLHCELEITNEINDCISNENINLIYVSAGWSSNLVMKVLEKLGPHISQSPSDTGKREFKSLH